jgi:hypothetical protein
MKSDLFYLCSSMEKEFASIFFGRIRAASEIVDTIPAIQTNVAGDATKGTPISPAGSTPNCLA